MSEQLKTLFKINLLYLNPQYTQKLRKKNKTSTQIIQSLFLQYGLSSLILGVVYGFMIFMIDFNQFPGLFTFYAALFIAMSFSQIVISIYNVFFQSKDLASYAPLPLESHKVFLSKLLVVTYSSLAFLIPAFILFLITSIRSRIYAPFAILLAFFLFVILFIFLFEVGVLLVFGLIKSPLYKKYQKTMNSVLVFLPNLLMVVAILAINFSNNSELTHDRTVLPILNYLYDVTTKPFSRQAVIFLILFIVLILLLAWGIKKLVLPHIFDSLVPLATTRRKKNGQQLSLKNVLFLYNKGLISEPTLLTQTLFSSIIVPVIMLLNLVIGGEALKLDSLPNRYAGIAFVAGILFAGMTINATSLISNIISLDKDNYAFITSLPLSKKMYLKNKFWFTTLIHLLINVLIALLAAFLLRLPLIYSLLLILGSLLGSILYCEFYFYRDYRLLSLQWTNVSQLFNRGMGNFGTFISIFGSTILLVLVSAGYFVLLMLYPDFSLWVNLLIIGAILAIILIAHLLINKRFWKTL